MIKTVKVKKKLRLDELIKYAWDNQLNKIFTSDKGLKKIMITQSSIDFRSLDNGIISLNDNFTVEMEEEITKDTVFECLIEILPNDDADIWYGSSVNDFETTDTQKVYALIEGKLELIWERDSDELRKRN